MLKVADSYMANEQYELAYDTYAKGRTEFPDSIYGVQALYQMGECQLRLDNIEQAESIFARIRKEYPNSDYAPKSGLRMAEISLLMSSISRRCMK